MNLTWSWSVNFFLCFGFSFLVFCWESLHLCSWGTLVCGFLFSCYLVWFWYQDNVASKYEFRRAPLFWFFKIVWEELALVLLESGKIQQWSPLLLSFSLWETLSKSTCYLYKFSISSSFNFDRLYKSRNLSISRFSNFLGI
jgi:hypothetical protein